MAVESTVESAIKTTADAAHSEQAGADKLGYVPTVCPATRTIKVIGGRWKLCILYHLSLDVQRYSDLQRCLPGITPKMLTQQLRELEDDGIVHREVYRQVPPKVEYSLTARGQSLRPVIEAISEWGRNSEWEQNSEWERNSEWGRSCE